MPTVLGGWDANSPQKTTTPGREKYITAPSDPLVTTPDTPSGTPSGTPSSSLKWPLIIGLGAVGVFLFLKFRKKTSSDIVKETT